MTERPAPWKTIDFYKKCEGKYLILDREDTKEARQHKALHVFIAAGMYLVLGIYNCFLWKKSDNKYNNGPGYQALD